MGSSIHPPANPPSTKSKGEECREPPQKRKGRKKKRNAKDKKRSNHDRPKCAVVNNTTNRTKDNAKKVFKRLFPDYARWQITNIYELVDI